MDLRYSQVAQLSRFSNDRMVDLIKEKIAESENAAVALVFDDKLVILDESSGNFYTADYQVVNKALNLTNWEPVKLVSDNETKLESVAEAFFDPIGGKEVTVGDIVEAFKLKFSDEPVKRLINRAAMEKKGIVESNDRIKALREVRKTRELVSDEITDIMEDPKIKALMSKMSESGPVQASISKIDFKSPLSVSLFEEVSDKVINLTEKKKCSMRSDNVKKKVKNMWTSESFKTEIKNLIGEMAEAEDAKKLLEDFVKQHVEILVLEVAELEDLVLKTALMIGEAAKADGLVALFKEFYNLDESKKMRDDFISRNNITEKEEDPAEKPAEETDKAAPAKETSIDEDSINKILKVLNKINDNLEEKTMEGRYVQSFITALEDAKVGSIGEGKLKEVLDFLTSVYEQAKSEKDSEEE